MSQVNRPGMSDAGAIVHGIICLPVPVAIAEITWTAYLAPISL